jgi:Na+/phosphate symporter
MLAYQTDTAINRARVVGALTSSAMHLDVLTKLKRVNSPITNIAYAAVEPNGS